MSVVGKVTQNEILLSSAAKNGDQFLLQHLLDKGISVQSVCKNGSTPLHYAVVSEHISIIEILLKKGASIYIRDRQGKSPLDLAVESYTSSNEQLNVKSAILILLLSYTLLDPENIVKFTFLSVEQNDEKLLKFMLKKDVATRIHFTKSDKRSLLHIAAELNYPEMVNALIEYGADVHARTLKGETPLHLAAAAGSIEIVSEFLKKGVQIDCIDNNGCVPLHYAIRNNRRNVILFLTSLPENLTSTINEGLCSYPSLLHYAVIKDDEEFFNLALKRGNVDLNPRTKDGETPLHFAIVYNRLTCIYELVKRGVDVNAKSSNGETPLHLACALGQSYSVDFLLKNKADVNCLTSLGATPLHYTLDRERCNDIVGGYNRPLSLLDDLKPRLSIVKSLLKHQALHSVSDHSGKTALHYAMMLNFVKTNVKFRIDIIKCLLDSGANVNAVCNNGFTPIFYGFDSLDERMVWSLFVKGANLNCNQQSSFSFLSKAIKVKNLKMIEVLLEAGVEVKSQNLFEICCTNELDKNNYFELLEMLTNRIMDIQSVITKISQIISFEWHLTKKGKEIIINKLIAILVRRELLGEIVIKDEQLELDDCNRENILNRISECRFQVLVMKKIQIDPVENLSLYSVFIASIDKLAILSQNQKLKTFLNSDRFVNDFPNCFDLIQSRFKKARMRKILLDVSSQSLFNLVNKGYKIKVPNTVRFEIVQYLGLVDLTHLMQFKFVHT